MLGNSVYWCLMHLYYLGIFVASAFNAKARLWIKGRKKLFDKIKLELKNNNDSKVWFHCASLGEFEQARPVIETFKEKYPDKKIILTFFSPSGYEIRKNYPIADWVFYLPVDTPKNARKLVELFNPELTFFVKYDLWYFILRELHKKGKKIILFSAIFRPNQIFFNKIAGKWYGKVLFFFSHIFVQDKTSMHLLKRNGLKNVSIAGDTRFDRVVKIAQQFEHLPLISYFVNDKTIVAGSTWEEDENLLAQYIKEHPEVKLILAPHEVTAKNISRITRLFNGNHVKYSELSDPKSAPKDAQVMIIDTIGLLSKLYKYATVSYVGGGFGNGIHNLLEAIVFGKPVVFGPNHKKFKEALDLLYLGIGFTINDYQGLDKELSRLINDSQLRKEIEYKALRYIYNNTGATEKILKWVENNI